MSDVLIFNKDDQEDEFWYYVTEIKKNARVQYCQGKIGEQFVTDTLDGCDWVFVHTFNRDIRGFACVTIDLDKNGNEYLYIDLICNSMFHSMATRETGDDRRIGGKGIIDKVINLGLELNVAYIKLSAIDDVIPYYYKLGFRFMNIELEDKAKELVESLRESQKEDNEAEVERKLNLIIKRYYPGYLSERTQQQLGLLSGSRIEPMQEQGIPMIYRLREFHGGKKVPKRYIPKQLTRKDKKKQRSMLKKSRKMYKKRKYYTRKKVKSFKSKVSPHITKAKNIYNLDEIVPSKSLSRKTGCSIDSLSKIVKKGQGAYYSSGSRPNQSGHSWGYARLASSITGGKAAAVDYNILKEGCKKNSKALKLARKSRKKHGHGKRKTPSVKL